MIHNATDETTKLAEYYLSQSNTIVLCVISATFIILLQHNLVNVFGKLVNMITHLLGRYKLKKIFANVVSLR